MAKRQQPAEGAAITESPDITEVRSQIQQMSGYATAEALADAMPDSTVSGDPDKPRRKRRTKEEMAASRGQTSSNATPNDLLSDLRYQKAIERARGMGIPGAVKGGFKVAAVALKDETINITPDEETNLDDSFYILSRRLNFDPANSIYFVVLYPIIIIMQMILVRLWKRNFGGITEAIQKMMTPEVRGENPPDAPKGPIQ